MNDTQKTQKQPLDELANLRSLRSQLAEANRRVADLEEALQVAQEGEQRFRRLFEQTPIAYQSLDEDGCLIEVNQAWLDMLDYAKKDVLGRSFAEFLAPGLQDDFTVRFERFKAEGQARDVEWEVVRQDGARLLVSLDGMISYDQRGNVHQTHCTMCDITEHVRSEEARVRAEEALRQRNRQLTLLDHAGRVLNDSLDPGRVLTALLEELWRMLDVTACSVWLLDPATGELVCEHATGPKNGIVRGWRLAPGQGIAGWVAQHGESMITPDTRTDERYFKGVEQQTGLALRSLITVPLQTRSGVIGVIQAVDTEVDRFDEASLQLLESLASAAAVAIGNARLFEEVQNSQERLQVLSQRLVDAQETERRRIARELHAVIGQALTAVKINLQAAQRLLESPDPEACAPRVEQRLGDVIENVEQTLQQVRDLSTELRPSLLDDLGLAPALRWYLDRQAQQVGFSAQFIADPTLERRLSPHLEIACFRITQEALTNVARHAQAQWVTLQMHERGEELALRITDDGVGFDVGRALQDAAHGASMGLLSMQERAALAGGEIEIASAPAQGTAIRVRLPFALPPETEEQPR